MADPLAIAWTAVRGAARYEHAVRIGDVADRQVQLERTDRCVGCPSLMVYPVPGAGAAGFCGTAFEDRTGRALPTCGCLVGYTPLKVCRPLKRGPDRAAMAAAMTPAGKAVVGSERCPQGKW